MSVTAKQRLFGWAGIVMIVVGSVQNFIISPLVASTTNFEIGKVMVEITKGREEMNVTMGKIETSITELINASAASEMRIKALEDRISQHLLGLQAAVDRLQTEGSLREQRVKMLESKTL